MFPSLDPRAVHHRLELINHKNTFDQNYMQKPGHSAANVSLSTPPQISSIKMHSTTASIYIDICSSIIWHGWCSIHQQCIMTVGCSNHKMHWGKKIAKDNQITHKFRNSNIKENRNMGILLVERSFARTTCIVMQQHNKCYFPTYDIPAQ